MTTTIECASTTTATAASDDDEGEENKVILRLLQNKEKIKSHLTKLAKRIYKKSVGNEARFECIPENTEGISADGGSVLMGSYLTHKMADCVDWMPELPEFFGLFHAYVRNYRNDCKEHKLFIITSGGCTTACDNFFNLNIDVGRSILFLFCHYFLLVNHNIVRVCVCMYVCILQQHTSSY